MNRSVKKILSFIIVLCIAFSVCVTANGSVANELSGHWAEETLGEWVKLGLLKGDNNGNYNPDKEISRAEFMALVNRVMNYTAKSDSIRKFTDVSANNWYYADASKALAAGYINGTTAKTLSPEDTITREQAITIISRIKGIDQDGDVGILSKVSDSTKISDWAKGPIAGAIREGLVAGSNGRINPKTNTTRSEAVVLLDRVRTDTRMYYFAGTYGPESGTATAGNVVIASPGIKLRNIIVTGDLEIAEAVGEGEATLDNVAVRGKVVAKGGSPAIIAATDGDSGSKGGGGTGSSGTLSGGGSSKGDGSSKGGGGGSKGGGSQGGGGGGGGGKGKDTPVLTGISISSQPSKLTYELSETLDLTGLVVKGSYSDNTTKTEKVTMSNISGFDSSTAGEKTITVTVNDKIASFSVNVRSSEQGPDTIAPTVPTNLIATVVSSDTIKLSWAASTDNIGVKGYRIYRDGMKIGETGLTNYSDTGITMRTQVRYTVTACDAAGNVSVESSALIKAADCEYSSVSTAVETANSGDTVLLPPGNSVWVNELSIPNNKKLTLMGSGPESSVISTDDSGPKGLINIGASGSRISGIGFQLADATSSAVEARGTGWRVDHCRFDNLGTVYGKTGVSARGQSTDEGCPVGLIDHCEFNDIRAVVNGDASLMANKIWAQPLGLGTNNTVFIEDCIYNFKEFGNGIDANYGGRYVFRYNVLNDTYIEAHSVQATHRATRSWEVYGNIINQANRSMWAPLFIRGGTGVIFDNLLTGKWSSGPGVIFDNVRSFSDVGEGGLADGTSPWDGNEDSTGYPARDQIGRSTDAWLWTDENPYPPQEHDPAYLWNNKHERKDIPVIIHNNCGLHIQENRDYYNGVGKLDYVPYPYPHPLAANDNAGENRTLALTLSGNKLAWNTITDAVSYMIQKDWQDTVTVTAKVHDYVISGGSVYYVKALDAEGNVLSAEGVLVNSDDTIAPDVP